MAFQPSFGKIYTYFDLKRTFMTSIVIFEVGSVVCAAAPSSRAFIIGRAVAGFGAAGIFCGGLVIVANTVHMHRRPLFLGIVTSMYGVASVLGPTLGGLMTDSPRLTWRFCFWVNLRMYFSFWKEDKALIYGSIWRYCRDHRLVCF